MRALIKIFLVGLILQFVAYNFTTYVIGYESQIIWLWKEIFVIIFALFTLYQIIKNKDFKSLIKDRTILTLEIIFVIMIVLAFAINTLILHMPLSYFISAFKYDFFGFMIFFIALHMSKYFTREDVFKVLKFYGITIKILLILAVFWYMVIRAKPGGLKYLGYERNIHEGRLGMAPPAVYLTQKNHGYTRNQFVFERPISWGFFLVMFWPMFFILFLRKKPVADTRYRWFLYGFNIFLTFSRAAWGAWFIQLLIIGALAYRKQIKKFLIYGILPLIIVFAGIIYVGRKQIISREFSNTGHIKLLLEGLNLVKQSPLLGRGAGSAGPASHQVCASQPQSEICQEITKINADTDVDLAGFNPENQYVQILVEFGAIIFLLWIMIYGFLNLFGLWVYFKVKTTKQKQELVWYLVAFSVGMIGLSIEGMALHSFVDRMIVYPGMLLYGLTMGVYVYHGVSQDK